MSFFAQFRNVSDADKSRAIQKLIADSTPDYDFFIMAGLSILMATFGLLINSVAVVIGSMLIAPILYPVLSVSLGMTMSDRTLISRSIATLLKLAALGIGLSAVATLFFTSKYDSVTAEILARAEPSLLYFAVAIISGIAISVALVRPHLSEALPGVAVSVALIPPLSVIGIGLAKLDWSIISGSTILFLMNVIGIVFASMVSFSLFNLYVKREISGTAIKKEEVRAEKEEKEAEKLEKEEETKKENIKKKEIKTKKGEKKEEKEGEKSEGENKKEKTQEEKNAEE